MRVLIGLLGALLTEYLYRFHGEWNASDELVQRYAWAVRFSNIEGLHCYHCARLATGCIESHFKVVSASPLSSINAGRCGQLERRASIAVLRPTVCVSGSG